MIWKHLIWGSYVWENCLLLRYFDAAPALSNIIFVDFRFVLKLLHCKRVDAWLLR